MTEPNECQQPPADWPSNLQRFWYEAQEDHARAMLRISEKYAHERAAIDKEYSEQLARLAEVAEYLKSQGDAIR